MKTVEDKIRDQKIDDILAAVTETNELVHEIKLWRRFVMWGFGLVTAAATIYETLKDVVSWKTK